MIPTTLTPACSLLDEGESVFTDLLWRIRHASSELSLNEAVRDIPRLVGESGEEFDKIIEAAAAKRLQFEFSAENN